MTKSLYIIDGHAQIYAAFYAPIAANFTAPDGEPTKATFIFTNIVLKLLRERQPDMLVVAMDAIGPTFRHEIFPDYKANRPPMPDDLPVQISRIEDILTAMRIPIFRQTGYEADDIIGTMSQQALKKDLQVYICSKDKDLEQLLGERVAMYDPKNDAILDTATLLETKGIRPEQVVDVLALQGDSVDNIPGIPDVGPKTALQWIQKYGSLDQLLAHKDEIKGKRGDNLRAGAEQLKLSRRLATIDCRMPLQIDFEDLTVKGFDLPALGKIFRKLSFRKQLEQLSILADTADTAAFKTDTTGASASGTDTTGPAAAIPAEPQYILVDTSEAFEDFYSQLSRQKTFAIDTETTSINPVAAQLVGLSFSWQPAQGWYLPVRAPLGQECLDYQHTLDRLRQVLANPEVKKTGQNIKYDMIVLRRCGMELRGVDFDTMVASYVLDSVRTSHSLDNLAMDYLGHETIKLVSLLGKGKNQLTFDMVDLRQAADYAAEDAEVTWRLRQLFDSRLTTDEQLKKLFHQVEMPLVEVLAEMEYHGIALETAWLRKLSTRISERLEQLTDQIYKEAGCVFNIDSPNQLARVLFDRIGLTPGKKTKTGSSTDQEVLEMLSSQHPVPLLMLEYRQLSKLKNTYVDKLPSMICPDTSRIHASFNQTITATGRLSSSNPNLQNIPIRTPLGQEIRRAFVPQGDDEVILAADYSQIELRLLAHFSHDAALAEAFRTGQDIHRFVAAQIYDIPPDEVAQAQRAKAKAVNFGIIYGQTAYGLSRGIGIPVDEAQRFINDYFDRYPEIRTFIDNIVTQARKDGYVSTILARRRVIPDLASKNANRRKLAERMAVNTVVQGSAADLIKVAMINIYRRIKQENLAMKMILQIHDELVFELPADRAKQYSQIIQTEMAQAIKLDVPVTVDVGWGRNWLECK